MIKLTLSLIVLIITYFLIFTNRRIRATSAFFGAILAIISGIITFDKAITYIDFNRLGTIIGMMIFIIIAKESGIFQYLALKVIKYSRGNSLLILSIVFIASFFSHIINLNLATIYLSGVIILLIIGQDRPDEIYAQFDWRVIFFLIGLNILKGTLVENGLTEIISSKLLSFSGEN